jgi:hypothetical protein
MDTGDSIRFSWYCNVQQHSIMTSSNMSNANNEQVRRPGWIFLIPVVIIVTAITWFIVAMAGR